MTSKPQTADYVAASRRYAAEFARLQNEGRLMVADWPRSPRGKAWAYLVRHVAAHHGRAEVSMGRLLTEARGEPKLWAAVTEIVGEFTRPTALTMATRVDQLSRYPVDGLLVARTPAGVKLLDAEDAASKALATRRENRRRKPKT